MYRIASIIIILYSYSTTDLYSQSYLNDLQFIEDDIKELIAVNYLIFNNDIEEFQEFMYELDYQPLNEGDHPFIQMVKLDYDESGNFKRELQPFIQVFLDGESGQSNISLIYALNTKMNLPYNLASNLHNHIRDLFDNANLCLTGYECETILSGFMQQVSDHYEDNEDFNMTKKHDHIIIDSVNPNKKSKIYIGSNFMGMDLGDGETTIIYSGPVDNVTRLKLDFQEQDDGTFYYKVKINSFATEGNPNTDFDYKEFMKIKGLNDVLW